MPRRRGARGAGADRAGRRAVGLKLPSALDWWSGEPGGAAWLAVLPGLAEECARRWELELEEPFGEVFASLVVPARSAGGSRVVLKLNAPGPESEHEGDALAAWDGRGAVRLLAQDRGRRALLLEAVVPGDPAVGDAAGDALLGVLPLLWRPPGPGHPFRALTAEAARWAEEIPAAWERFGRPFERTLVDRAVELLRELTPWGGEPVLLHGDLHGGNVLRGPTDWVAIDPKPLVGEPAFDLSAGVRNEQLAIRDAARLGLDPERVRGWALAHALAWGWSAEGWDENHVALARELAAGGG